MSVLICQFCENDEDPHGAELDPISNGYWCSACDGYTYLQPAAAEYRFTLILEDDSVRNSPIPEVNISLNKRLSPLRYPGGKSKIIPLIYSKLYESATQELFFAKERNVARSKTSAYSSIQKARRVWCEGSFGTMKRCHNLANTYKKGIRNATEHCLLSALALNIKRMVKAI